MKRTDTLLAVGYLDDMALLGFILKLIHSDVVEYKKWRVDNGKQIIEENLDIFDI